MNSKGITFGYKSRNVDLYLGYDMYEMSDCSVAMNNAFRKIFGLRRWESIHYLRELFGFESIYVIFKKTEEKFMASCKSHPNLIVNFLANLQQNSCMIVSVALCANE